MHPDDLQLLTAFLTFGAAVISVLVPIIGFARRWYQRDSRRGQPQSNPLTNGGLLVQSQPGPSAIQPEYPASKANDEPSSVYEVKYQVNNSEENRFPPTEA